MTQPTQPESYENEVVEAVERALASPLTLAFPDRQTATMVTHRIYGYIKALRATDHPLAGPASGLMVKRTKPNVLVVCRRDEQPLAIALREALKAATGTEKKPSKVVQQNNVEDLL